MKANLFVALCLLSGCERGLATLEAERAVLARDEANLAALLSAIAERNQAARAAKNIEENRAARANAVLREQQVKLVETWKGEASLLATQKAAVKAMPKALSEALDLAQSTAGGEATEKRFARAIEKGAANEVGPLVNWWETVWLAGQLPPEEEEAPPKVCPTGRTLTCKPIDDDALWCPDGDHDAAWAMLLENGTLTVGRFAQGQSQAVDARLAPRIWLTRVRKGDRELLSVNLLKGNQFYGRLQLPVERDGARLESVKLNFDGDPWLEAILWRGSDLYWVDPTSEAEVTVWSERAACEALSTLENVPPPPKALCQRLLAPPTLDAGTP